MYKWLAAGCAIGFGIGLFLASTLFETWLAPFGNPITIGYTIWDWGSQTNFWKFMGIIWIIAGTVGIYFLYRESEKTKPLPEPSKNTQKNYTEIAEEPTHEVSGRTTVTMASMKDLQKIANTTTKPILHQKLPSQTAENESSHVFYVLNGTVRYQFTKTPPPKTPPSTSTTTFPINPPTTLPQKRHLIIKRRYLIALGSIASCTIFIAMYLAGFLPWLQPTIPTINLTLPALPTTSSKELVITLVVLGVTAIIGFMTIKFRRMKRKQPQQTSSSTS